MLLVFTTLSLAFSSIIPLDEVALGLRSGTSPGLRSALLSDAFTRLDTNNDGFLTKAERKPLFDDSYIVVADTFTTKDNPQTVMKADFIARAAVPDMADTQNPTKQQCELEAKLVQTRSEDVWKAMFKDADSVTVLEFASKMYDTAEEDVAMSMVEFSDAWTKQSSSVSLPAPGQKMHVYQLDSYTDLHNDACKRQRRELFVAAAPAAAYVADIFFSYVVRPIVIVSVMSALECGGQQIAHSFFPTSFEPLVPGYGDGCTWKQFRQDWWVTGMVYGFSSFTGKAASMVSSWIGGGIGAPLVTVPEVAEIGVQIGYEVVDSGVGEGVIDTVIDVATGTDDLLPSMPEPTVIGGGSPSVGCVSIMCIRRQLLEMAKFGRETKNVVTPKI